jgi:hypothetical protein
MLKVELIMLLDDSGYPPVDWDKCIWKCLNKQRIIRNFVYNTSHLNVNIDAKEDLEALNFVPKYKEL